MGKVVCDLQEREPEIIVLIHSVRIRFASHCRFRVLGYTASFVPNFVLTSFCSQHRFPLNALHTLLLFPADVTRPPLSVMSLPPHLVVQAPNDPGQDVDEGRRRSHRKSRAGCSECKRRRIKVRAPQFSVLSSKLYIVLRHCSAMKCSQYVATVASPVAVAPSPLELLHQTLAPPLVRTRRPPVQSFPCLCLNRAQLT